MKDLLEFVIANIAAITGAQQGLFSALALICQLAGWTAASKIFGTLTTLDLGRVARYLQAKQREIEGVGPTVVLLLAVSAGVSQSGCAMLRSPSFWDKVETGCEIALSATPEVDAKAKLIGGTVGDVAAILCGIADVIEPFVKQELAAKEGRMMATNPTAEAIEIAKAKGLL